MVSYIYWMKARVAIYIPSSMQSAITIVYFSKLEKKKKKKKKKKKQSQAEMMPN